MKHLISLACSFSHSLTFVLIASSSACHSSYTFAFLSFALLSSYQVSCIFVFRHSIGSLAILIFSSTVILNFLPACLNPSCVLAANDLLLKFIYVCPAF